MKQDLINRIERIISHQNADESEILLHLKDLIYETEMQNSHLKESKSISSLVSENLSLLNNRTQTDTTILTGFPSFDKLFGGFSFGELVVIGGRPSMGKTQLCVNLALNISQTFPVLFFTFDLSASFLTHRFISSISKIAVNKLLHNDLSKKEKDSLTDTESSFSTHQIFINESCSNSLSAFKTHCKNQIEETGARIVIVDYLQMMSSGKYRNNRELEISHVIRELRIIAKDYKVCVIATSQLNRSVELRGGDKQPQLSDLRESGAIEQDADKIIFIFRPEYYDIDRYDSEENLKGLVILHLAKNKNGSIGTIKLRRNKNATTFLEFEEFDRDFTFAKDRLDEIYPPF